MRRRTVEAALLALACLPGTAHALSSDRNQPVEIEADRGELDDTKGLTTYEGRVVVTQGTLKITGDRVVLHYDKDRQVHRAEAYGKPATYEQLADGEKEPVRARALRMDYLVRDGVIELYDEATVTQAGDTLSSSRVTYDTVNNRVKATRSGNGDDRVRVILAPKPKGGSGPGGAQ
jgi:lipopolysaccharide export system protein LptA